VQNRFLFVAWTVYSEAGSGYGLVEVRALPPTKPIEKWLSCVHSLIAESSVSLKSEVCLNIEASSLH